MDLDFDDLPSDHAPAARAGARFKPKGKPQPKKKQVSLSTSQTTLPAKEKLLTQEASTSETVVLESGTINQSTTPTLSEKNVDVFSRGVSMPMESSVIRACTNVGLEEKRSDDGDDPITQDSAVFRDFAAPATDEDTHAQTERMQTGEEESPLDMESLDIVQEEGITSSAYQKHSGKFQPKPRLLDTVIEEPESRYSVDDTGFYSMGTNESEFTINGESRNDISKNTPNYGELQEEEGSIPQVPREMVPEMEAPNASGEEQVVSPSINNTVLGEEENGLRNTVEEAPKQRKLGKKGNPRGRKRKTPSVEEPKKSKEKPKEKKFKHSVRRQRRRTLDKELLETPDDEIRFLPIKDMLRLVEYKEWLEKKEAKGAAAVVPPTQESNMNASENQDYSHQGFDAEDDFGMEESEYQETSVVKPDSPVNYQTYMNKTQRSRWSKEDTELFYEGIQEFGSNLSMVQQLFPDRTRQQIKLKFKLEERRHPLKINDALSSRSKHLTHFKTVIKKLQQEAAAAREGEEEEGEEREDVAGEEAQTTTDVPDNEEPVKSDETERAGDGVAGVKESDGVDVENGVKSDGGNECDDEGDDDDFWNSYKSDM